MNYRTNSFENIFGLSNQQEPRLQTFKVSGLNRNDNDYSLKQLCSGAHIVSAEAFTNHVTGSCTGQGLVKIRVSNSKDLENVKLRLVHKGFNVSGIQQVKKRHSETPRSIRPMTSLQRKLSALQSSDDLYGNSRGVGRLKSSRQRMQRDCSTEVLLQWTRTRQTPTRVLKPNFQNDTPRYMSMTVSQSHKKK